MSLFTGLRWTERTDQVRLPLNQRCLNLRQSSDEVEACCSLSLPSLEACRRQCEWGLLLCDLRSERTDAWNNDLKIRTGVWVATNEIQGFIHWVHYKECETEGSGGVRREAHDIWESKWPRPDHQRVNLHQQLSLKTEEVPNQQLRAILWGRNHHHFSPRPGLRNRTAAEKLDLSLGEWDVDSSLFLQKSLLTASLSLLIVVLLNLKPSTMITKTLPEDYTGQLEIGFTVSKIRKTTQTEAFSKIRLNTEESKKNEPYHEFSRDELSKVSPTLARNSLPMEQRLRSAEQILKNR